MSQDVLWNFLLLLSLFFIAINIAAATAVYGISGCHSIVELRLSITRWLDRSVSNPVLYISCFYGWMSLSFLSSATEISDWIFSFRPPTDNRSSQFAACVFVRCLNSLLCPCNLCQRTTMCR